MDYVVFVSNNGNISYVGLVQNVKDFYQARRAIKSNPQFARKKVFLVKSENFMEVT